MSNNMSVTGDMTLVGTYTGVLQTKVATLSDLKASGTAGGASAATSLQDRTLNTRVDPHNLLTLDGGNVLFSFNATGYYYLEVVTPHYKAGVSKCYLTKQDNTIEGIGSSSWTTTVAAPLYSQNSVLYHILNVTSTSQNYKIRQYTDTARATNGLGIGATSGEQEVYTNVTVIKLS